MRKEKERSLFTGVLGGAFAICIAFIVIDVVLYAAGLRSTGMLFVAGMAGCLFLALVSAFTEQKKGKTEDVLTMLAGLAFFAWLAWKEL